MKQTGLRKYGAMLLLAMLLLVFSVTTLVACNSDEGVVTEISVDTESVVGYYVVEDFDITKITIDVTYQDGSVNSIAAQKSMLTTEGANSLKTAGEKSLTLTYKGKTTILNILLVEDGSTIAVVTFNSQSNTPIAKKYTLVGGSVEVITAPEVEGMKFIGWVDGKGNAVDFTKINESMTVTAAYSEVSSSCKLSFVDPDGEVLKSSTVDYGTKITDNYAPTINLNNYPEASSIGWSVKFPYEIKADTTINMVITPKMCTAFFKYAYESNTASYITVDKFTTTVKYGENVNKQKTKMEEFLKSQGLDIVTSPSQSTTLKQDGSVSFNYVVKDSSVVISVYNDQNKNTKLPYDSPMAIGKQLVLPTTAATVSGHALVGWKIEGEKGSVTIDVVGDNNVWVVTKDLGLSVSVIPVYAPITIQVKFVFDFRDDKFPTDTTKSYKLTLSVNDEFASGDVVTYRYIDNLLANIVENKSDYIKLLQGQSVSNANVIKYVSDNGDAIRENALNNASNYNINSVKFDGENITAGGSKIVLNSGAEFVIAISSETQGITWEEIKDSENNIIGYAVAGLNANYVDGENVFIPDERENSANNTLLPVLEIKANALENKCVTRLSSNLTTIGDYALKGATIYGDVVLENLTTIGEGAFSGVTFVGSKITLSALTILSDNAFENIQGENLVVDLGKNLIEIGSYAFDGAQGLLSVTIPKTVEIVGDYAFNATALSSITDLSGITRVGEGAFKGTALTQISLPSVTSIGDGAFANIEELVTLTIGDENTSESSLTFDFGMISGSENVTTLNFGASVSSIDLSNSAVLSALAKLTTITVGQGSTSYYADQSVLYSKNNTAYTLMYYPNNKTGNYKATLPSGAILTVDATAFSNATVAVLDLSAVTVSAIENHTTAVYAVVVNEEMKTSAESAFSATVVTNASDANYGYDETTGLIYQTVSVTANTTTATVVSGYKYAESITVPAKLGGFDVTKIADGAFKNFALLETLTINATLDGWNSTILSGTGKLSTFTVKAWNEDYEPQVADFAGSGWYARNNVLSVGGVLVGYNDDASDKIITEEKASLYFANGIPSKFFENSTVKEVYLPTTVKIIGDYAFSGSALEKFTAQGLTAVGNYAFKNTNITEIVLNFEGASSQMGNGVFYNCKDLVSAEINGMVGYNRIAAVDYYSLPAYTFYGCSNLSEVTLEKINDFAKDGGYSYAFSGCSSLKEFDFTKIIGSEIPARAFNGSGITYAILNSTTLTTIGQEAFNGCSGLEYVIFGATVTKVGIEAFGSVNNSKFIVELSYDNGGLYESTAVIGDDAFANNTQFYISRSVVDPDSTFLYGKAYTTTYPTLNFALTNNTASVQLTMSDISNKVFIQESDVVPPTVAGYTFAGWFSDADETMEITFPLVLNGDKTLYAKYYDEKQGSLDATSDVQYVYYLGSTPDVSLDQGETAEWYYSLKDSNRWTSITSLPLVLDATDGKEYVIKLEIKNGDSTVYSNEYDALGEIGYAIVNYDGANASRITIPEVFDDGQNGEDDVIVLYAGAFKYCVPEEFFLPASIKAIFKGTRDNNDSEKDEYDTTFGTALKYVTIPASVEYIEDGVFAGSNIEEIIFEEGSNLAYVTDKAFVGSKWWNTQIETASANNGFIIVGRMAIRFVGTADVLLLDGSTEYEVDKKFGLVESTEDLYVYVTVFYNDGTSIKEKVSVTAVIKNDGVYCYELDGSYADITFALNTVDSADWTYTEGKNLFILNSVSANAVAISISTVTDTSVTVPSGVVKLADNIFAYNKDINTLIVNKELVTIGEKAFAYSALNAIRYGETNSEQYESSIAVIGDDAFAGTDWYTKTEKVILGTIFLKYNNVKGTQALMITEGITAVADSAFEGATLTSVSISSSTLKTIGAFAFKQSSIRSITIPTSVTKLGRGIFAECSALISVDLSTTKITALPDQAFMNAKFLTALVLPKTVTELGKDALTGCAGLTTITADGIAKLDVDGSGKFASGLEDTAWYTASNAEDNNEDTVLRIGNVLIKYIVGAVNNATFVANGELTVEVPAGITMIAYKAFFGVNNVTEVVIPDSVVAIDGYAFSKCTYLHTVQIGSGVTEIGMGAFDGSTALKNAILPNGLVTIGDYAFQNTAITSEVVDDNGVRISDDGYTIPNTVTSIGAYAFYGVNTLTMVNIGGAVTEIGRYAFDTIGDNKTNSSFYKVNWAFDINKPALEVDSNGLSPIEILINNVALYAEGIFNTETSKAIRIYADKATIDYFKETADAGVGAYIATFKWDCYETGTLPTVDADNDGYTLSPFSAEYIKEGDIPTPLHSTEVGKTYTFMYWVISGLDTPISYPYVVTKDTTLDAIFYCNEVDANKADDNGVIFTAEGSCITGISNATETLYIPNKIGGTTITAINVNKESVSGVKNLIITNASNFNGMTQNIFDEFVNLESIELCSADNSVADYKVVPISAKATVGDTTYVATFYALYSNDTASTSAYGTQLIALIGNTTSATELARQNGYDGTSTVLDFVLEIPEGVTTIQPYALKNTGLMTVTIPSTLTTIGSEAFSDQLTRLRVAKTISLSDVAKDAIPSTAPIYTANAGSQITSGNYIEINGLKSAYGLYGNFYAIANVLVNYDTQILSYNTLELPNVINGFDITVLGSQLISSTTTGEIVANEISLPTNLSKICDNAFENINFYDVKNAEGYARLRDIADLVFDSTDFYINNQEKDGLYVGKILVKFQDADDQSVIKADTIAIASGAFRGSQMTKITIPESVVSIGTNAFYGCVNLVEVTIPNSVTAIGDSAFASCINLTTVNIDTINSTLATIGNSAFMTATKLKSIRLPYSLKSIGENAFSGCTSLLTVSFDGYDEVTGTFDTTKTSQLTELGKNAFTNAKSLTSIKIPDGVTVIKDSTFLGCTSLVTVEFGRSSTLKEIERSAFADCAKLGSAIDIDNPSLITVSLPNSLITIGQGAFQNCSGMWGISLGYHIAELKEEVFSGCINLAKVEMRGSTAPTITNTTFDYDNANNHYRLRVYVNADSAQAIQNHYVSKWSTDWGTCAKYIYEATKKPVAIFTQGSQTKEVETDIIVNPSINFGQGEISMWNYSSLVQEDGTTGTRTGSVGGYGYQSYVYNDATNVILVIDYDVVTLTVGTIS